MNSRERVLRSFRHRSPDRVPMDYTAVKELNARLMERFNLPDYESLLLKLKVDFRHLDKWGNMVPKYIGPEPKKHPDGTCEDCQPDAIMETIMIRDADGFNLKRQCRHPK